MKHPGKLYCDQYLNVMNSRGGNKQDFMNTSTQVKKKEGKLKDQKKLDQICRKEKGKDAEKNQDYEIIRAHTHEIKNGNLNSVCLNSH